LGGGFSRELSKVAKVPPENSPLILSKNAILTKFYYYFLSSFDALRVVISQGIESNAQQFTIQAPVLNADSSYFSIIYLIQATYH
jgi:hypothetical protein